MKEIVQQIIETEKEVRERIDAAREQAQKIVRSAETHSREVVEEGRQAAVREGQKLIEELTREAEEERSRKVAEVGGGSEQVVKSRGEGIDRAVDRITRLVKGSE